MNPEAAKLLAPRSVNLQPSGGIPDLTSQDISHALGTLKHRYASLVLRVKIAGQDDLKSDLFVGLYTCMMESGASRWQTPRHRFIYDLCHTALSEFLAPSLCPTCNGLGNFRTGDLTIKCDPCIGTGKYRQTSPADTMQIDDWNAWDGRYGEIIGKLYIWENIAIGALNRIEGSSD